MNASATLRAARLTSTLAALVLLAPSGVAQQWVLQSPLPHGLLLHDVAAPTPDVAFLASDDSDYDDPRGGLFRTTDGGVTWDDVPLPPQFGLYDVFFFDAQRGWAVGDENHRTTNGGQTWQRTPFLGSTYTVEFYTPSFGLATGNFGLAVSRNGGVSWGFSPNNASAFDFRGDQVGLSAAPSGIRRTTNGGQSFALVRPGAAEDVAFLTDDVAVGIASGQLVRSGDGGQTWSDRASAQGRKALRRVNDDVALAFTFDFISGDGRVVRTADGGQTWSDLGVVIPGGIERVDVVDAQTVLAVTPRGNVWRSADAGATWTLVLDPPTVSVLDWGLDFAGPHGFVVGGAGLIYESFDAGLTWRQNSNGYGGYITDMDRFDDRRLITTSVLLTDDGGARWTLIEEIENGTSNAAVQVVDPAFAVLLDLDGRVLLSADSGYTWTPSSPIPTTAFTVSGNGDVHFRSRTEGWVVGYHLQPPYDLNVWRTTNAGQTWTRPSLPNTSNDAFSAVDFEGERGWIQSGATAGGFPSQFLLTEDGGATWAYHDLPNSASVNMHDVEFFDENTGYVVGSRGYAARSTNGGRSWTVLNVPAPPPGPYDEYILTDLYLTSPTDVWVSSVNDAVLHSTNGGLSWETLVIDSRPESFGSFTAVVATADGRAWVGGAGGHIYALDPPASAPVAVVVAPLDPPVVIGPGGGSFGFTVTLTNTTNQPQTFQAWTEVTGPVSRSPVLGPQTVTLPAGATLTRTLTQAVPGNAPSGTYTYTVNVGSFPGGAFASDSFPFTKQAARQGDVATAEAADWSVSGWDAAVTAASALPEVFALSAAYPNPTAGPVRLTLALPATERATVAVYDALGRRVAVLHDGVLEAGTHVLALDASAFAPGVYVVRATGDGATAVRRLVVAR